MKPILSVVIVIALFLSACSTPQYATVSVNYTPLYHFKTTRTTILIVNRARLHKERMNKKDFDVIHDAADYATKYTATYLKQLKHVRTINLADSTEKTITTDSIQALTAKYHADYLLIMTGFNANINLDAVANSTSYYNTVVSIKFKLYESNGVYFKQLDGESNDPQSEGMYTGIIGELLVHPRVRANKQSINTSVEHAIQNAFVYYFPYTITHTRPLYNDKVFKPAVNYILSGDLEKADSLLKPLLTDKDPDIASKAAYNLAVVYESKNDVDGAYEMAMKATENNHHNDYASAMLMDLKDE